MNNLDIKMAKEDKQMANHEIEADRFSNVET